MAEAPPATTPPPGDMSARVNHLNRQLDELEAQQKAARATVWIAFVVLLLIMLVFGVGLYYTVTSNLSAEKIEPVLMERVEANTPQLQRTATEAVSLAMPTYQRLAREEFAEITPELRDRATEEVQALPDKLRERLSGRMQDLEKTLDTEMRAEIKKRFGDIPEERIEMLAEHFSDELLKTGEGLQASLEARYDQQASRLETVLDKFEVADQAAMNPEDLQFKLIENAALLVVHLARNPDELPVMPGLSEGGEGAKAGSPMPGGGGGVKAATPAGGSGGTDTNQTQPMQESEAGNE